MLNYKSFQTIPKILRSQRLIIKILIEIIVDEENTRGTVTSTDTNNNKGMIHGSQLSS